MLIIHNSDIQVESLSDDHALRQFNVVNVDLSVVKPTKNSFSNF